MRSSLYCLLLTGLMACTTSAPNAITPGSGVDVDPLPPASSAPGFGNSKARPLGTPFAFPAGITLVQKPRNDSDCWYEARQAKRIKGAGNAVAFCVSFSNSTNAPIRVELPPGLIWVAETSALFQDISQNGILVKTVTILVPAHAVETAWLVAYCINYDRDGTRPGDTFEAQPILSNHPGISALAKQLATKKINEEEYASEPTAAERQQLAFIGVAVVDVQTYGTVQPSTQAYLNQLPNAR
ncbi:putative lipoprotein [Fibrella aestuarina BUZ 2]|uniref:Putative lipoprotein n=1 Tax=Fibrella aestuarina BUZ 2 TaxID=1166018 RepID=I0K212_9BACT|nr:hypothetical protein [Fibrella aestuarina]CCG98165.1 putative lipoprotein [Fibrella aestuarina BUZ 2]